MKLKLNGGAIKLICLQKKLREKNGETKRLGKKMRVDKNFNNIKNQKQNRPPHNTQQKKTINRKTKQYIQHKKMTQTNRNQQGNQQQKYKNATNNKKQQSAREKQENTINKK